jgi:hypothetical protein
MPIPSRNSTGIEQFLPRGQGSAGVQAKAQAE